MPNKEPFYICRSKLKKEMASKLMQFIFIGLFLERIFSRGSKDTIFFFFSLFFSHPSLILQLDPIRQLYQGSDTVSFGNCLPRLWLFQTVGLLENNRGIYQGIFPNGNSVHFLLKIAWTPNFLEQYLLLFQIIRGKNTGIKM